MDFVISRASLDEWKVLAKDAHMVGFGEDRPAEMCTYDWVLTAAIGEELVGYIGIIEHSSEAAYMQHGAAMPNLRGTGNTREVYDTMMAVLKAKYKTLTCRVLNKNIAMLKLHFGQGLFIVGCDCYTDGVYLHLRYECQT